MHRIHILIVVLIRHQVLVPLKLYIRVIQIEILILLWSTLLTGRAERSDSPHGLPKWISF